MDKNTKRLINEEGENEEDVILESPSEGDGSDSEAVYDRNKPTVATRKGIGYVAAKAHTRPPKEAQEKTKVFRKG